MFPFVPVHVKRLSLILISFNLYVVPSTKKVIAGHGVEHILTSELSKQHL